VSFSAYYQRRPPDRCIEVYYLKRTRFESIAERKPRRRQLTEDGNVEISGRDLREGSAAVSSSARAWRWRPSPDKRRACQMSMRWAYLNVPRMTKTKKITTAAKSNPATIFPLRATPRRTGGRRG
jgi:hypothetical protein